MLLEADGDVTVRYPEPLFGHRFRGNVTVIADHRVPLDDVEAWIREVVSLRFAPTARGRGITLRRV